MRYHKRIAVLAALLTSPLACGHEPASDPVAPDPVRLAAGRPDVAAFPGILPLPPDFQPEGITVGRGTTFFVGSIISGAVWRGDLRTGGGSVFVPPALGTRSLGGLDYDPRSDLLFAAGVGAAYAFDGRTGEVVGSWPLTVDGFVNDVVVTRDGAWFTDSYAPRLFRLPLDRNGRPAGPPETLVLGGDFQSVAPCPILPLPVNANGIDATREGDRFVVVNLCLGLLYSIDPATGVATEIDLGGETVPYGDGILLEGRDLYVAQNFLNQIAHVRLDPSGDAGTVVGYLTSPALRIPSTIARFGSSLYAVNARFDVAPPTGPSPPGTEFEVVRVTR